MGICLVLNFISYPYSLACHSSLDQGHHGYHVRVVCVDGIPFLNLVPEFFVHVFHAFVSDFFNRPESIVIEPNMSVFSWRGKHIWIQILRDLVVRCPVYRVICDDMGGIYNFLNVARELFVSAKQVCFNYELVVSYGMLIAACTVMEWYM